MPNTASTIKRLRQSVVRRARNRAVRSTVRTHVKKVLSLVTAGDLEAAESEYRRTAKLLDRAGARKVIHANAAARQKSRLQRLIKKAKNSE